VHADGINNGRPLTRLFFWPSAAAGVSLMTAAIQSGIAGAVSLLLSSAPASLFSVTKCHCELFSVRCRRRETTLTPSSIIMADPMLAATAGFAPKNVDDVVDTAASLLENLNADALCDLFLPPSPPWEGGGHGGDGDDGLDMDEDVLMDFEDVIRSNMIAEGEETSPSSPSAVTTLSDILFKDVVYDDQKKSVECVLTVDPSQLTEVVVDAPISPVSLPSSDFSPPATPPKPVVGVNHCGICKLVFADVDSLNKHHRESAASLKCCHCGKRFASSSHLAAHGRKHSREKPFRCGGCGKFYTTRETLTRHRLRYCQSTSTTTARVAQEDICLDKPLLPEAADPLSTTNCHRVQAKTTSSTSCRVCSKEFFDAASLKNHTESHMGSRTCCACHRTLGNRSKLITHHRTHTGESPYACTFCGKRFAESSTLRKHEATHGARNHQCKECGRGFVRRDYLAKHMLTHRQTYRCSECPFVSHDRADMEAHVGVHA